MQAARKSAGKSPSITELLERFETAIAATKALPSLPQGELTDPAFDRAVDKCSKIAWRIVRAPAASKNEILKKIAIAGWCIGAGHKELAELDRWQPQRLLDQREEHYALATLRDDVQRLCA